MTVPLAGDFDKPDPRLVAELVARYEASAKRLRDRVLDPPGKTANAQAFNQARASQVLAQVDDEVARLRGIAADWTGTALDASMQRGIATADRQAERAGVREPGSALRGTFSVVDRRAAEVLARDTVTDLIKAADSMRGQAANALRRMAATGVTNAEVNAILTAGVIEGRPGNAIRELREALKLVHGKQVTIIDRNGDPITFAVGRYARMVALTKTRQATRIARHARLADKGIGLVKVVGRISDNFCTAYLDQVYSLTGDHPKYPSIDSLPNDGPPFHVQCSKSTAPFVEDLADPEDLQVGAPDPDTAKLLGSEDTSELQRKFKDLGLRSQAEARRRILQEAR